MIMLVLAKKKSVMPANLWLFYDPINSSGSFALLQSFVSDFLESNSLCFSDSNGGFGAPVTCTATQSWVQDRWVFSLFLNPQLFHKFDHIAAAVTNMGELQPRLRFCLAAGCWISVCSRAPFVRRGEQWAPRQQAEPPTPLLLWTQICLSWLQKVPLLHVCTVQTTTTTTATAANPL